MKKKKIKLLVIIRHPVGGIRTYLKYTYKYLDPENYDLTILTVRNPEGSHIKNDLGGFVVKMVEVEDKWAEIKLIGAMLRLLSAGKFDIIHSQGFTAGVLSVVGNCCFKIPHILTSHDVLRKDQFDKTVIGGIKKWLIGLMLSKADVIQSVSYDAEANLIEYYPHLARNSAKSRVILNGIDVEIFCAERKRENSQSLRHDLGVQEGIHIFGFLGRFMPQKGFEYLVDAVEILAKDPSYVGRLKILAVNDGAFIREYKSLIDGKNLSDYFIFHGFIPDVRTILEGIDALVMPSLWEAYGLIAAEALLVGCPVIASDCIGLREVVRNTPALVVKMKDGKLLADAMRKYIDNAEAIRDETNAFIPIAKDRFDSRKTAEQLNVLFDDIAGSGQRKRTNR